MILSRARDIADIGLHVTTLTGHSIERVSEYKYLGIWLDVDLNLIQLYQEVTLRH